MKRYVGRGAWGVALVVLACQAKAGAGGGPREFNGQTAFVSDTSQRPFVISVIPVVGDFAAAYQPVIVVLNESSPSWLPAPGCGRRMPVSSRSGNAVRVAVRVRSLLSRRIFAVIWVPGAVSDTINRSCRMSVTFLPLNSITKSSSLNPALAAGESVGEIRPMKFEKVAGPRARAKRTAVRLVSLILIGFIASRLTKSAVPKSA